jgi:hypothetical protein
LTAGCDSAQKELFIGKENIRCPYGPLLQKGIFVCFQNLSVSSIGGEALSIYLENVFIGYGLKTGRGFYPGLIFCCLPSLRDNLFLFGSS